MNVMAVFAHQGVDYDISFRMAEEATLRCFLSNTAVVSIEGAVREMLFDGAEDEEGMDGTSVGHILLWECAAHWDIPLIDAGQQVLLSGFADLSHDALTSMGSNYSISRLGPSWWSKPSSNDHAADCCCTPITLLDALTMLPSELHSSAVEAHLEASRSVWEHHWAGLRLWGPSDDSDEAVFSDEVPSAGWCAECIVDGLSHIEQVREEANWYAMELGEALAAFNVDVTMLGCRYNPHT